MDTKPQDRSPHVRLACSSHAGRDAAGCGRAERWERVGAVRSVRMLVDTSSVEVFVNDGELVMSTRWYPQCRSCAIMVPGARIACWELNANA